MRLPRFDRRTQIDWRRLAETKTEIVAAIRTGGHLDMIQVFDDATARGALAELENDGIVQPLGPVGPGGLTKFRVAVGDEQREEFKRSRRQRDERDFLRGAVRDTSKPPSPTDEERAIHKARCDEYRRRLKQ